MSDTRQDAVAAMADAIVRLVEQSDHVTFAELDSSIPGFSGGFECLRLGGRSDYIWFNMTETGAKAVLSVMGEHRVAIAATSSLTYLLDGRVPNVPVAKSLRPHKKDRWVPTCLRPARLGNCVLASGILFHDPNKRQPKTSKKPPAA